MPDATFRSPFPPADLASRSRRSFLAGAAIGAVAGATPAWAQESAATPSSASAEAGSTIAGTLARYAANLTYRDLPPEVARTAKRTILDTLGCALGGYSGGPSRIAIRLATAVRAEQGATILCDGARTSPDLAAFSNGVMIRYLDFNDGYISAVGGGHPSDVIAALLPVAELAGRSGRDLITATALAYEVFCKVADVQDIFTSGLDHSTITGLAAVVGAGTLMGLTEPQLVHAIGIHVAGNTAINQGRLGTLSNWKSFASAEACRKAIFAAQLAKAGMTGPAQVFEGRAGFFRVIRRAPFELPPLGGRDAPFGIMRAFTKRFALGQYAQTVVQAAAEARQYFKNTDEIREATLRISRNAIEIMADTPEKWRPQTRETADHSIPYAAGVALMYGTVHHEHYEDPYLHDARLLDLVGRIKCVRSDEADKAGADANPCILDLALKSGEQRTIRVDHHRGHWKNPMTDAEMEEKFRYLAGDQLPAQGLDMLLDRLWALEDLPQAGGLAGMTRIATR